MRAAVALVTSAALCAATACGRIEFDPERDALVLQDDAAIDAPDTVCVGTAACFLFEGDVSDRSGNGNNGAGNGLFGPGHTGLALVLDAGSDVRTPESGSLTITAQLTLTAWIRVDALPAAGARAVIADHDSAYILWISPDGRLHATLHIAGAATDLASVTPDLFTPGQWQHVVMTYDGAQLITYRGPAVLGSKSVTGPIDPDPNVEGLRIGGNLPDAVNPSDDPFVGAIDQLRIWNRVVPRSEYCQEPSC